jgi:hypothetical protein
MANEKYGEFEWFRRNIIPVTVAYYLRRFSKNAICL